MVFVESNFQFPLDSLSIVPKLSCRLTVTVYTILPFYNIVTENAVVNNFFNLLCLKLKGQIYVKFNVFVFLQDLVPA